MAPVASAHELLDNLWLMNLDGTALRPIGTFRFDGPRVRWTAEPNDILLYDEDALYQVDLFNRQSRIIFQPGGYRGFDWWPGPVEN